MKPLPMNVYPFTAYVNILRLNWIAIAIMLIVSVIGIVLPVPKWWGVILVLVWLAQVKWCSYMLRVAKDIESKLFSNSKSIVLRDLSVVHWLLCTGTAILSTMITFRAAA